MPRHRSRRSLLRASAGVAASTGIAALAGCSSVPFLGGDGSSSARDWLYDPTAFTDEPAVAILYEAPSEIDAASEHLHPEVREQRSTPMNSDDLDPAATDWALQMSETLFEGPFQVAYGGSFDEEAAREAATAAFGDGAESTGGGEIGGFEHVTAGNDNWHGAYRDGTAVSASAVTTEAFEDLVEEATGEGDRLSGVDEEIESFLDVLGFDHTATASIGPSTDEDGNVDGWVANGTGYRIGGETTTVRLVQLNWGWTEDDLRRTGEGFDGLRETSVESEGPVKWLEAVADTDRLALNGNVFQLLSTPYE